MADRTELLTAARRVARHGLPGSSSKEPLSVTPLAWPGFLEELGSQRLTGLAVAASEEGDLLLAEDQRAELDERHRQAMTWALFVERTAVVVTAALEDAGVKPVILKGPAVAHTAYPDPAWRPFGDADLLVPTADWKKACRVIEELGFVRRLPEPRAGFDQRFGKAAEYASPDGLEVDLHRTLVLGPFGLWLDADELHRHTTTFVVGGQRLRRLDAASLLLHACMHASLGFMLPLLWTIRDVAQIAVNAPVDWEALADRTQRWKLRTVVAHAFATVSDVLDVRTPQQISEITKGPVRRSERRALAAYVTTRRARGGASLATIRAIPGWGPKARYVIALLVPAREFMRARGHGRGAGSYLARWATPFRWLRGTARRPAGKKAGISRKETLGGVGR